MSERSRDKVREEFQRKLRIAWPQLNPAERAVVLLVQPEEREFMEELEREAGALIPPAPELPVIRKGRTS